MKILHAKTDDTEEKENEKHADDKKKKKFNLVDDFCNIFTTFYYHDVASLLVSRQLMVGPLIPYLVWSI